MVQEKQDQEQIPPKGMMNSNTTPYHQTIINSNITSYYQTLPTINITSHYQTMPTILGLHGLTSSQGTCGGVAFVQTFLKRYYAGTPTIQVTPAPAAAAASDSASFALLQTFIINKTRG